MFFLNGVQSDPTHPYRLWKVDAYSSSGAILTRPQLVATLQNQYAYGLTGSADGSKFAIVLERAQPDVYFGDLHQPGPTLTEIQRLTYDSRTDFPHAWLPGSQSIVFESDRSGRFRIYTRNINSRNAEAIEVGSEDAVLPQVSPDGRWILFVARSPGSTRGSRRLLRVPVAGGVPAQVPIGGNVDEFQCPLSGKVGCVLRETIDSKEFVYYALDPVQGKGRELGRTSWMPNILDDWSVSPDATMVALPSHDPANRG